MKPQDIAGYVDASAAALGLTLQQDGQDWRPGVLRYFALAASFAEIVEAVPLTPADESGMAFVPVLSTDGPQVP